MCFMIIMAGKWSSTMAGFIKSLACIVNKSFSCVHSEVPWFGRSILAMR
jgi:hypothetical protein